MHDLHERFHRLHDEHHRRRRGAAFRRRRGGRGHGEASVEELEEYQRDLEQRVADVAERIRRLRSTESDDA
jgi:hypothetical protein